MLSVNIHPHFSLFLYKPPHFFNSIEINITKPLSTLNDYISDIQVMKPLKERNLVKA